MPDIREKNGAIILESDEFDLKVDKSRKIYIKRRDVLNFTYIGHDIPIGYTSDEKKKMLYEIYRRVDSKLKEE
jgi:hypothetical protein